MNLDIHPTPAVALGAYEVTPLEIAGAYTIFANNGVYSKPHFLNSIANDRRQGQIYRQHSRNIGRCWIRAWRS